MKVLRVVLEGITEEDAQIATVTLEGVGEGNGARHVEIEDSWLGQGLTSEFDLDEFLAREAERGVDLRTLELEVEVDHPHYLREKTRVPLSRGIGLTNGKTVYQARVRLVRPEYWPEFTLAVRDAYTGTHLDDIELVSGPGMSNFMWGHNPIRSFLADGLSSPVVLMGGRDADEPGLEVPFLGLRPAAGEPPQLVEIAHYMSQGHGVIVYARAPGYAWGSIALDLSKSEPRELLLKPGSAIDVRLTNVQLERYRALETQPMLCINRIREDGGNQGGHFKLIDETFMAEGLQLDGLNPGEYRVTVELGGGSWTERPVLASEELAGDLALVAGETRTMVLELADSPTAPERATLGGTVSLPDFGGEEEVRLQLYFQPTQRWRKPDVEFSLSDLQRTSGALPSWSFRAENLPVGMYRVQLLPFLKTWMIELPADGREDLELILPELAEVLVETVNGQTGERVPLDEFHYRRAKPLPGQEQNDHARADTEGPGRFRFWTVPGEVAMWPRGQGEFGFGGAGMDLQLVPGRQSVRFELAPACRIHFEFRVDGAAPRVSDEIWEWIHYGTLKCVRAVDHAGRSRGRVGEQLTEVTAPGVYEISFEELTGDRFHPISPRLVDVRAGETAEVIVELHRK